jgi:hypothetical protein
MNNMLYMIFGFITGGVAVGIGLGLYYKKSYQHLLEEVNKLRELSFRMLETMEITGLIEWQRDSFGNIKGLEVQTPSKSSKRKTDNHNNDDKNRTIH